MVNLKNKHGLQLAKTYWQTLLQLKMQKSASVNNGGKLIGINTYIQSSGRVSDAEDEAL